MQIAEESNNAEQSAQRAVTPILVGGGATGPRTEQGKQKSKRNALKHGIFSKVVLLKGEPQTEFDSLLIGLRNDLDPEGALEEFLVDKLSVLIWRHRRLIIMEAEKPQTMAEQLEREHNLLFSSSILPLDKLLRYETSLERTFDRTLNQLERLQRIRKGQPVPPTLNVNVST